MKLLRDHIDYLKDNPEGYWFKRKLYGFGWTPAKPAGWVLTVGYLVVIIILAQYVQRNVALWAENPMRIITLFATITILFIVIVWRTGEPLKWQWGLRQPKDQ